MIVQEGEGILILRTSAAAKTVMTSAFRPIDDLSEQRRANTTMAALGQHPHVEPWTADVK
jgi:hypothetical protein